MPQNVPVRILQGHAHVADGPDGHHIRFVGVELQQSIGKMNEPPCIDDLLAGWTGDIDLIVLDPSAVHPEGQGPESAFLGKVFRHPGAVRAECLGKILYQGRKKLLAGCRGGAFENRPQRGVGLKIL